MIKRVWFFLVSLLLFTACTLYPVMPEADVAARKTAQAIDLLPTVTSAPEEATATAEIIQATAQVIEATMEATPAPECLIKGNVSSSGERIYHFPGGSSYARTVIDPEHGEAWFCTEDEALEAGWRKALR